MFKKELYHLWNEREKMKIDSIKNQLLLKKMVKIMQQQEMDLYDDFQDLPKEQTLYYQRFKEVLAPEMGSIVCRECRQIVEKRKPTARDLAEFEINKELTDLDKPATTSQVGAVAKVLKHNSVPQSEAA